ncbi:DUF333 domain-containing protein (plasmid) [Pantoea agglomerans]|uniref:putative hemolysin n=1 Tax=Enterobacter agglomerans TaxID=549 RepID=UPI003AADDEF6
MRTVIKVITLIASTALLAACSAQNDKPQRIGMANPVSVYCEKMNGKLYIVKCLDGESGYCTLPSGSI